MIRALSAEWVEEAGFEVREAGEGAEAIACLEAGETFVAAVLDVTLPDMDGATLAVRLREIHPGLPVLFATGNPGLLDEVGRGEGATEILDKPYSMRDLDQSLAVLLDRPSP